MSQYYFLSSSLPSLQMGGLPELAFKDLRPLFAVNLTKKDAKKLKTFQTFYDLQNLRASWMSQQLRPQEFSSYGSLLKNELEDAILTYDGLPGYVYDFLDRFDNEEKRLQNFSSLLFSYFQEVNNEASGFLSSYLTFEKEWRLVFLGFRAKKMKKDVIAELQYEDPSNEIVAQILAQKDASSYEPPSKYEKLKSIFETKGDSPISLHQSLCEYRFLELESFFEGDLFSIDRILGYIAQLIIVEEWLKLDQSRGLDIMDTIVKDVS